MNKEERQEIIDYIGELAFTIPQERQLDTDVLAGTITEYERDDLSMALDAQWQALTEEAKSPYLAIGEALLSIQEDDQNDEFVILSASEALDIRRALVRMEDSLRAFPYWVADAVLREE